MTSRRAVLLLSVLLVAGCAPGVHTAQGPIAQQPIVQPQTQTATLEIQMTNESSVPIIATATTPEAGFPCGDIEPGATITVTLNELPATVDCSATALSADSTGVTPTFTDIVLNLDVDYSAASPVATIFWRPDVYASGGGGGCYDNSGSGNVTNTTNSGSGNATNTTNTTNTTSTNTGSTNTTSTNTGSTNTTSTNTGSTNTTSTNTGSTNTTSTNTGSTNTTSTNTGSTNTSSTNTTSGN